MVNNCVNKVPLTNPLYTIPDKNKHINFEDSDNILLLSKKILENRNFKDIKYDLNTNPDNSMNVGVSFEFEKIKYDIAVMNTNQDTSDIPDSIFIAETRNNVVIRKFLDIGLDGNLNNGSEVVEGMFKYKNEYKLENMIPIFIKSNPYIIKYNEDLPDNTKKMFHLGYRRTVGKLLKFYKD